jgi:hypothetical protein
MTDEEKKSAAIRQIENAGTTAKALGGALNEASKSMHLVQDVMPSVIAIFNAIPADQMPPGAWDKQMNLWQDWEQNAGEFHKLLTSSVPMSAISYNSVNTTVTAVTGFMADNSGVNFTIQDTFGWLMNTLSKQELADKAIGLLKELDLDHRAADRKCPVDLLIEAREAMERPATDDSVTSILIPLRESIEAAITELVRRRPQQEEAKKTQAKVISIGAHCGKTGLSAVHFEQKGEEAAMLLNRLSGAKQAGLDRVRLTALYQEGLLLLAALLESVDGSKLRAAK